MKKPIDSGLKVIHQLKAHGHLAYFVGGVVRDFLLGMESNDIDITTSAHPEVVMDLFEHTIPTGLKYGTVTVMMDNIPFEVTTFRKDGTSLNHRHPDEITYSQTLDEDLIRRDYTINALAMSEDGQIIDLVDGKKDIDGKLIRAVGNPKERFKEDSLRILRAFRFVSKCDFDLEEETQKAIVLERNLLKTLANERVIQEFQKLVKYPHKLHAFKLMKETKIGDVFPELNKGIDFLSEHETTLTSGYMFLTLCFYFYGEVPEQWRLSNKDKTRMNEIITLMNVTEEDSFQIEHLYSLGKSICLDANTLNKLINPMNDQEELILHLDESLTIRKTCDLVFKGSDILSLTSLKDATIIGDIIDDLTNAIIHGELHNDYEELKSYTMKKYFKE